ncbi:MAG: hypothetical protein O6499_00165 [Candidatus Dadabacteria bacterium]|nr:hypothetical protein [Candidatus Dadabacteria bacterium]
MKKAKTIVNEVKYQALCTGPNKKLADEHKDREGYHYIMSKFYLQNKGDQMIFMAMFDQMAKNKDESQSNKKGNTDGKST